MMMMININGPRSIYDDTSYNSRLRWICLRNCVSSVERADQKQEEQSFKLYFRSSVDRAVDWHIQELIRSIKLTRGEEEQLSGRLGVDRPKTESIEFWTVDRKLSEDQT